MSDPMSSQCDSPTSMNSPEILLQNLNLERSKTQIECRVFHIHRMMESSQCYECLLRCTPEDLEKHRLEFERLGLVFMPQINKTIDNQVIFLVRRPTRGTEDIGEIRVAVVGNVDAGKSTMLGVLTQGVLDDGRGKARVGLFRHKHELESGRTSSIGQEMLAFRVDGSILQLHDPRTINNSSISAHQSKIAREKLPVDAHKIITFLDLAGHEKYLKTTMFGLTGGSPDYAMLMVGANAGLIGMAKEHLGLAFALGTPVLIVVTKIDMCPEPVLAATLRNLQRMLKSAGCRRTPLLVKNTEDVLFAADAFTDQSALQSTPNTHESVAQSEFGDSSNILDSENLSHNSLNSNLVSVSQIGTKNDSSLSLKKINNLNANVDSSPHCTGKRTKNSRLCPIFQVSNVSGEGIDLLRHFLNLIPIPCYTEDRHDGRPPHFQITENYTVPGVGTVVAGTMISGSIGVGQIVYLGPESNGLFSSVTIKSVQRKRLVVPRVYAGQCASFALKKIKRSAIKKGMVLVGREAAVAYREFDAEIVILNHGTTIGPHYQAMLHCGVIRQTVIVVGIRRVLLSDLKGDSIDGKCTENKEATGEVGEKISVLRTGDRAIVRFRFSRNPEFLRIGDRLLFREGRTKGVGRIIAF